MGTNDPRPTAGDIVITTIDGRHHVSIYPHPARLTFTDIKRAHALAKAWKQSQARKPVPAVAIWFSGGDHLFRLAPDADTNSNLS